MAAQDDIISTAAIYRSLVRLETKQDNIIEGQAAILTDHVALKARMDKVENRQQWYMGAFASIIAIVMAVPKFKDFL